MYVSYFKPILPWAIATWVSCDLQIMLGPKSISEQLKIVAFVLWTSGMED